MAMIEVPIETPGAWRGPEIDYTREGLHIFSASDIEEIDAGLRHLKALGDLDFLEITPATFPLDKVGTFMRGLRDRLRFGRGFLMVRGIPRERYDTDDLARIYFGVGCYLGTPMTQSYLGDVLGHVINVSDVEPKSRGYRKGGGQSMHSDSADLCDIIGLMCVRSAASGGISRITSGLAVYNRILATRPELAAALCNGYIYRRNEEDGRFAGRWQSTHRLPIFAERDGEVSCYLFPSYVRRSIENGDVRLTDIEREALAEFERLASSEEFYLDMSFSDGDIQFLNNRLIVHGRTDYVDEQEFSRRRHLMRLWLRVPDWPPLPDAQTFSTAEEQRRWTENRHKLMELPSVQLRAASQKAALH